MLQHADANFIQIFQEAVEYGNQISGCQLVAQDNRQFMDRESQCASHFPLRKTTKENTTR